MKIRVVTICYSHARTAGPPPLSSRIASRLVQPTTQPFGHVGSSSGGGAASPNDHWHSCVSKFGLTRRGRPSSEKSCCAGSLHELRHIPTVHDVTPVCNRGDTGGGREPERRALAARLLEELALLNNQPANLAVGATVERRRADQETKSVPAGRAMRASRTWRVAQSRRGELVRTEPRRPSAPARRTTGRAAGQARGSSFQTAAGRAPTARRQPATSGPRLQKRKRRPSSARVRRAASRGRGPRGLGPTRESPGSCRGTRPPMKMR